VIATKHVKARIEGPIGRITLDRPAALNALTLAMVEEIDYALDRYEADASVGTVLLDGAGERGFCAGADIAALRDSALSGGGTARCFWHAEYRLNARIAAFPKPVVAIMDGIVMGGGVGLSAHASHRVVTERVVFAMPEVMIGFAPDVGGTFLLSRTPGELGTWLALTASRLGAGDVLAFGLADHFVSSAELEGLVERLAFEGADGAAAVANASSGPAPDPRLTDEREWIDQCFSSDAVEEIQSRLRALAGSSAAAEAETALTKASPTSLKVTLAALRRAARLDTLEECLAQELATSASLLATPDFAEGIRAAVVDKDGSPRWSPASLEAVDEEDVAAILAGPDLPNLWTPGSKGGRAWTFA
jgi:enoyl-CoA hydratase